VVGPGTSRTYTAVRDDRYGDRESGLGLGDGDDDPGEGNHLTPHGRSRADDGGRRRGDHAGGVQAVHECVDLTIEVGVRRARHEQVHRSDAGLA
jgi:hypothetical protein